jgi:short-subunit dehydrogenase
MKKILIIGATSAIAQHCARLWVQGQVTDMTLVGRDAERLDQVAADLRVRSPQSVIRMVISNFLDPEAIQGTVAGIFARGTVDVVLIAHGSLPNQIECQDDLEMCRGALEVNGISPVLFAEEIAKHMSQANCGTLALIGSVAGDRGRKSNYVYGAAKGLVTRYAQGLQHRFAGTGVKVVLIKPGPTDTPMTAHLKGQGPKMASVDCVAQKIIDAVDRGQATVYAPGKWSVIMMMIRHLPGFIFNKLNI